MFRYCFVATLATLLCPLLVFADDPAGPVSFSKDVRPLLAEKCFGCHQPAQSRGDYVMTDFERMLVGGGSGDVAIKPGNPDTSRLIDLVTLDDGVAEMPPEGPPFSPENVALISRWIKEGANNDFTRNTIPFDSEHPPIYSQLPNLSSLDFSPDGNLLAVPGFNEVLLLDFKQPIGDTPSVATATISKRLIGLSSRIETVQFSPNGKRLVVSGGIPGELGEIQIWNVETGKILLSKIVSHDTVYGASWSPDGSKVSFGCTDTSLRVINSETGEQVLFQGAHEDWIRDTAFTQDGSQLVSVGRDMSCKLTDVATQRFMDNVTSITPGALKGGIASVALRPGKDEVLIGGADGIAKLYRLNRLTKRVIGDDANLIRVMPEMPGRIQSVTFSADGKQLAAGSSLDGVGTISVFAAEFDSSLPADVKKILTKQPTQFSAAEKKKVDDYITKDVKQISSTTIEASGIYAVAFHPSGRWVVAGGRDGYLRIVESETGQLVQQLQPVEIGKTAIAQNDPLDWHFQPAAPLSDDSPDETKPSRKTIASLPAARQLIVFPSEIKLELPIEYVQLVVQAELIDGSRVDVTDQCHLEFDNSVIVGTDNLIQAAGNGKTEIKIAWNGLEASVPAKVALGEHGADNFEPDFVRDVNPVLTTLGCNAGACHGSQGGKKGFKLSLRGYDPIFDIRAFTDDMASRRLNLAMPDASLMLLKPTAQVAHEGGKVIEKDSRHYHLILNWIAAGAKLDLNSPKVASIEVFPKNPMLPDAGSFQRIRVVATYADASQRDVTREAVVSAGDMEIASAEGAVIKALRRGESPILARYEGAYAATTLTVMGNRDGYVWEEPETWGRIDELVAEKWQRMKIVPSEICSDDEFIRRIYLDLTGLPPTDQQVEAFLDDEKPLQKKRNELIDQLIGNDSFVEHWSNKWADLLQVNRKYLGPEGSQLFRDWIRDQVKTNRPYNEFVYDILTASGSNRENPAASYYKIHRTPEEAMENTTHLFLGTRFNCNKCHDHPFERWTQDQYYQTAAFFSQIDRKRDPESKKRKIGGTAVEGATPLYEIISDIAEGEMKHERTGEVAVPEFPFDCQHRVPEIASRRVKLASWSTSPDNQYFATSYVNRLWGYMTGTGLIEPLDDIRAGNPPSNPELLEYLEQEFINSGFDMRHVLKLICKSRTYQLSVGTNSFNADDSLNYSHAKARRLPAEVLFDSIHFVTGAKLRIPGVAPGMRAAALPDSGVKLPSGFLSTLGRPARESSCECERANDLQLGSVLALVSGPDVSRAINDADNELCRLVRETMDDQDLIDRIYLKILNRHASDAELKTADFAFASIESDHQKLVTATSELVKQFNERLPALEKSRVVAIEAAQTALDKKIATVDPKIAEREQEHAAELVAAEKALKEYLESAIGFDAWKKNQTNGVIWHPLMFTKLETESGRTFKIQSDRSVLFEPIDVATDAYTATAVTDLSGISAVRLELLSHPSLPELGPGLPTNGNLVLTELIMEVAHPDRPDQWQAVPFQSAIANFAQDKFSISKTFDGILDGREGWALSGNLGTDNWASYQLKMPVGFSGGTLVRFKMLQRYDKHQIGRFRISISKHHQPVGLGVSESLASQLSKPEKEQSDETKLQIKTAFERGDPQRFALQADLDKKKQPLKIDPEIVRLRDELAEAQKPVPRDPKLVQFENDVATSEKQLANRRLTAVQDFTWALINSPSFLFNR